jgi:hypothetical protein
MREISRAPRYIAVASPGDVVNGEWNHTWTPVVEDYALLKVLFMLRQQKGRPLAHVYPFQVEKTTQTPLDFSGLTDNAVIFIVGHGDHNGLYAMGNKQDLGMQRLITFLTGDGNLKARRAGKPVTIVLLSCRAGLGLHQLLAHELAKATGLDVTVVGAIGFTFGAANTGMTGFNSVVIKGIPWWMEYPNSISPSDAEKETSSREGRTITIAGKDPEITKFNAGSEKIEEALKAVVGQLAATEVNAALNQIDADHRDRFMELTVMQSDYYMSARGRAGLGFDMWFGTIPEAYQWVNASQVTDAQVTSLLNAGWLPPGPGQALTR